MLCLADLVSDFKIEVTIRCSPKFFFIEKNQKDLDHLWHMIKTHFVSLILALFDKAPMLGKASRDAYDQEEWLIL